MAQGHPVGKGWVAFFLPRTPVVMLGQAHGKPLWSLCTCMWMDRQTHSHLWVAGVGLHRAQVS